VWKKPKEPVADAVANSSDPALNAEANRLEVDDLPAQQVEWWPLELHAGKPQSVGPVAVEYD